MGMPAAADMSMSSMATSTQQNRSLFLSPSTLGSLGSPNTTNNNNPAPELDIDWDADTLRQELQTATIVLSERSLKLAAKWASEQLLGLPAASKSTEPMAMDTAPLLSQETDPSVLYAKSLMELGEYMHAAAALSLPNTIVTTMSPPLPNLSSYGIFLRAYALYMAGERRKEEDYIELQR